MEKIYLTKDKINNLEYIGHGCEGRVLKLNNSTVIKLYNASKFNLHDFKFTNLNFKYIVLPKSKVYINKKFCGYSMNYIKGKDLNKISLSPIPLDKLAMYCKNINEEIKELSKLQVPFIDLNNKNIIYNEGFYIIDSFFKKNTEYSKENYIKYNIREFNKIIFHKLLNEQPNLINYILSNDNLKYLYMNSCPFDDLTLFITNLNKEKILSKS